MKTMLKVQSYYLLDKTAAAFIGLLAVFVMAAVFTASGAAEGMRALDADRVRRALAYRAESALAIRFGMVLLGIFMGVHGYTRAQRRPAVFFVASRADVPRFAAAKTVAAGIVLVVFEGILFIFYGALGSWFTPYFELSPADGTILLDALAEGLFFLFLQGLCTTLADTVFSAVPAFAFYWALETRAAMEDAPWTKAALAVVRHRTFGPDGLLPAGPPLVHLAVLAGMFVLLVAVFAAKDVN